jgi:hypothetical protein
MNGLGTSHLSEYFGEDKSVRFLPLFYYLDFGNIEMSIVTKDRMTSI